MTELREKIVNAIRDFDRLGYSDYEGFADYILALPEIADALKLKMVKPLNLGPSIGTGTREADD